MNTQYNSIHTQHKSGHNDDPTAPALPAPPSMPDSPLVPAPTHAPVIDSSSPPRAALLLSTQVSPSPSSAPARKAASILEVSSDLTSYKNDNDENESEMEKKAIGAAVISNGYMNRRRIIIADFLDFLKKDCSKYARLLELVDTPPNFPTNHTLIHNVWVCFSGEDNKREKIKQLNLLLINWVGNRTLKKTKNKLLPYPQPATLNMDLRSFFAGTKEYYLWNFGVSDFNFEGGYNGFFTKLMKERMEIDVS